MILLHRLADFALGRMITSLMMVMFALALGCGGQEHRIEVHNEGREHIAMQASPVPDYTVIAELHQRLDDARTRGEVIAARRALLANLRQRYAGIDASVTELPAAMGHLRRFNALMLEWNPIGFTADELASIVGEPTQVSGTEVMYRLYGSGMGSTVWRFMTYNDGEIWSIARATTKQDSP